MSLRRSWPAFTAALIWALAAGAAVWWGLHFPRAQTLPARASQALPAPASAQESADVLRALGQPDEEVEITEAQARFELTGVIATRSGAGSALIAVDGQPPQVFVRGQSVVDGWRLHTVGPQGVRLMATEGEATLELTLPDRP